MDSGAMQADFTRIHSENYWGGVESKSGKGSDPEQTQVLITAFDQLLRQRGIKSLVDLGCGDVNWLGRVPAVFSSYVGVDIVRQLVLENINRLGGLGLRFVEGDVTRYIIPKVDAILCRDVLCHLEYEDALRLIENVKKSESTWFISTTFPRVGRSNPVQPQGSMGWYPICLTQPPFNFPCHEELLVEGCLDVGFQDKSLGVWKVAEM